MVIFSSDYIADLKVKYNLAEVLRETVTGLRPSGMGEYIGSCPFHQEKTASFRVNKTRYHCFGCHVHGDIFSWIGHTRGLNFNQSVMSLSKGDIPPAIALKQREMPNSSPYDAKAVDNIIRLNETIQEYCAEQYDKWVDKTAKDFIDSRTKDQGRAAWYTTYAPNHNEMIDWLIACGYTYESLQAASIIAQDSRGQYYPRLRDRLVLPMFNRSERIIGFAGRAIPRENSNTGMSKYMNPGTTKAFSKKAYLYGIHLLEEPIDRIIIVEGYFDFISLHSAGVKNVLAILGTSLSKEQVSILESLTSKLYIMMDGDMPGLKSIAQHWKSLQNSTLDTRCILLTDGEDPDTVARRSGKDGFHVFPVITLNCIKENRLTFKLPPGKKYDRTRLDELLQKYVDDNLKQGLGHYNCVDWCIQAYPQYASELKATLKNLRDDFIELPNGDRGFKDDNIRAFLKAWIKPCRDVRKASI